jgi:hypothetical protein
MCALRQNTLDILDKELSRNNNYYLALADEVRFRFLREEFLLDKTYWDKYFPLISQYKYNWAEFKYTDINKPEAIDKLITTDEIGVYIFIIRSENMFLDMPKYVFYVGISGEGGSARPLRERLKDYFRLNTVKKRKKVHRMLAMYHSNVFVKYSTMNVHYTLLEQLEKDLHGFYYPICNERDFPIELKNLRQADFS